uniref:Uncharacterized protein n=1 Tax=Rhizophora mucronata TaxID=61149 RepID=A0A2P2LZ90_RHIMU
MLVTTSSIGMTVPKQREVRKKPNQKLAQKIRQVCHYSFPSYGWVPW